MSIYKSIGNKLVGLFLLFLLLAVLYLSLDVSVVDSSTFSFSLKLLAYDLLVSFLRVIITATAAWLCGIFTGYLLYRFTWFKISFLPAINFIRHISPFAWLPFAILWFGLGETSVAFIMFITLFFPTVIAASDQFHTISHDYLDLAKMQGTNSWQMFRYIQLPLSYVSFLNLFRILWGLGWSVIIAAEMLGVNNGLGFRILDFRYLLQYPQMLVYLVVMGCAGIIFDYFLSKIVGYVKKNYEN